MENPLYDTVLGNVKGVRDEPDPGWVMEGNAVVTRSQADKQKQPLNSLKVSSTGLQHVNRDTLTKAQRKDVTLQKLWEINKQKKIATTKEDKSWRTEVQNEVLYRVFEPNQDGSGTVKQVVVPLQYCT